MAFVFNYESRNKVSQAMSRETIEGKDLKVWLCTEVKEILLISKKKASMADIKNRTN